MMASVQWTDTGMPKTRPRRTKPRMVGCSFRFAPPELPPGPRSRWVGWSLWSHPPCGPAPPGPRAVLTGTPSRVTPLAAAGSLRGRRRPSTPCSERLQPADHTKTIVRVALMAGFETVSFLSDYGLADEFVGLVKAVIRDLAPHVTVIDLTHEIGPHDTRAGALALARCIQYVPAGV